MYETIKREKLPIPSKFHYMFNLRDVSKVFLGITQCDKRFVRENEHLVRLWTHETTRIYHDRLINDEDREWFYQTMTELINIHFRLRWEKDEIFNVNQIHYTDIMNIQEETKYYEDITDNLKIEKVLEEFQDDYNQDHPTKLTLCFFNDAVEHILRMIRI